MPKQVCRPDHEDKMNSRLLKTITLLLLHPFSVYAQTAIDGRVTLEFDYPASEIPGTTFKAYLSTNLLSPWTHIATVVGTNRIPLTVTPGVNFFVCTASNFWGESDFSTVASTPALPRSDVHLTIRRGN